MANKRVSIEDILCDWKFAIQLQDLDQDLFYPLWDPRFQVCPGGLKHHHMREGDLVQHTDEVLRLAEGTAATLNVKVNLPVLVTAALWHDYGKIFEYVKNEETGLWSATPAQKRLHHIFISAHTFVNIATQYLPPSQETQNFIDDVTHCILAHHGRKEWGSPVEPQTVEARILHQADYLSMEYGEFAKPEEKL